MCLILFVCLFDDDDDFFSVYISSNFRSFFIMCKFSLAPFGFQPKKNESARNDCQYSTIQYNIEKRGIKAYSHVVSTFQLCHVTASCRFLNYTAIPLCIEIQDYVHLRHNFRACNCIHTEILNIVQRNFFAQLEWPRFSKANATRPLECIEHIFANRWFQRERIFETRKN